MSHQPERIEKDCLNCGTIVEGRYCHICGQENIVTRQNAFAMVQHFVYDIFHFDGKFFDTLRLLLFKPGRVPADYIAGRRLKYLDPIRMYLFTSAVFFLVVFAYGKIGTGDHQWYEELNKKERAEVAMELSAHMKNGDGDPFGPEALNMLLDSTLTVTMEKADSTDTDSLILFKGTAFKIRAAVDSSKWEESRDLKKAGWVKRKLAERSRILKEKYGDDPSEGIIEMGEIFLHRLPYMLFISLPFFALILKLLYWGKKRFYYSDHLVFTLYHYIFTFILLLLLSGIGSLKNLLEWDVFTWLMFFLAAYGVYYLYKGLRNFYGERRGRTILKFLILNVLAMIVVTSLLLIFLLFTAFQP